MRLWSLHPEYLDPQGLVALWREALLAREVLRGRTVGYRHHPQLDRFRAHASPVSAINAYLAGVYAESLVRGYAFDASKLARVHGRPRIATSSGQLDHESRHLARKLRERSPPYHRRFVTSRSADGLRPHPLFRVVPGEVEAWERSAGERQIGVSIRRPRSS